MKARYHLLALLTVCALVTPVAFAQTSADGGGIGPVQGVPGAGGGVTARIFTTASLNTPSGEAIGKAKTATIQSEARGVVQGLRLQATNLTPGAEYALVIDGTLVGTETANSFGVLKMRFANPSNGRVAALPEAVTPIANVRVVQIYAVAGQQLVASGEFRGGPRDDDGR